MLLPKTFSSFRHLSDAGKGMLLLATTDTLFTIEAARATASRVENSTASARAAGVLGAKIIVTTDREKIIVHDTEQGYSLTLNTRAQAQHSMFSWR